MMKNRYLYWFNDKEHLRRFIWGLTFVAFLAGIGLILVPEAFAQSSSFSCSVSGSTVTANGNMFEQDTIGATVTDASGNSVAIAAGGSGTSNDDPYSGGQCTSALGIVGQILCFFKSTLGQIVSLMYCSFQNSLQGPLNILLTLLVTVIGVAIFTGMTRLTVREGMVALLKIALVWVFATNASWGIGIGYTFFMGLAEQGANIMIGAAASGSTASGGEYLTQPDKIIGGLLNYASTGTNTGSGLSLNSTLTGSNSNCLTWMFFLLAMLMIAMPWVATFIITLIIQYMWLYARALLGYLTALVLISFLFVLSPLFFSFALFQVTKPLFEQWLKYLVSFSLQIVIIFAFLAIMNLVPLGNFFSEILNLLRQYDTTTVQANSASAETFCNICQVTISSTATLMDATPPITCDGTGNVMPLWKAFAQMNLVQAIVSQVIALWIIGYVMLDFMAKAPEFARDLAGTLPYAAALGAGSGSNAGSRIDYIALDKIQDTTTAAPGNFYNSSFGRSTWGRMMPGAALIGGLGALSFMGRNNATNATGQGADGQTADGTSGKTTKSAAGNLSGKTKTSAQGASSNADVALQGASSGKSASGSTSPGIARSALVTGSQQYRYDASQLKVKDANAKMIADTSQVNEALNVVQKYKDEARSGVIRDPNELRDALEYLRNTNESSLISLSNLFGSQDRMFKEKAALNAIKPDSANAGKSQAQVLQGVAGDKTIPTMPGIDPSVVSYDDMKNRVDTAVESLRLQLSVQRYFLPEDRIGQANEKLEEAVNQIKSAQTTHSLGLVMEQLYTVQKTLA